MWLKSRLCVFVSIHGHRHAHLFLSVLFTPSLYFFLQSFVHLFLNPAMVPDENSMEDPLCNSSFGSMVSLDYVTPDTGCTFNLYSIVSSGLVPGGQNLSRRQTVFFLPVDPRDENHKDPEHIDFSVPRRVRYVHKAWKRHQDALFWVDFHLAIREGLVFYQTRSNAIILQGTLPAHCIVKVERLKTGEILYERQYLSPRSPPKISLKHDLNWTKGNDQSGSTVEHRPVGKLVQQSLGETLQFGSSKPTQSPKPIEDRSGKPRSSRDCWCVARRTKFFRQNGETRDRGRTTCPKSR